MMSISIGFVMNKFLLVDAGISAQTVEPLDLQSYSDISTFGDEGTIVKRRHMFM